LLLLAGEEARRVRKHCHADFYAGSKICDFKGKNGALPHGAVWKGCGALTDGKTSF